MENYQEASIPVIDLNDFFSPDKKKKFVTVLGKAYENIGFVGVKNHRVKEKVLNAFYDQVKLFFDLPLEIKEKYNDNNGGQRGYTAFGIEHAKGKSAADLKEFWHFGQWVDATEPELNNFYPKNKDVIEITSFNDMGKCLYRDLEKTAKYLLQAIALFLELEENYFDQKIHNGNNILRPIHYPPILSEPHNSIRAGEHEDINLITLLVGASADGLEVLNKKNEWVPVTKVKDCIIVNVGDMLQRLTNNRLKSTTHRVVNPPKEDWNKSRYSIPFFLHPRPNVSLACLDSCVTTSNPKQYTDISAIDYLNERLAEIGLKK